METTDIRPVTPAAPEPEEGAHLTVKAARESAEQEAVREVVFDVRDLSVFYGDFRAVRDVTLPILEHEITALIGPSGCGKSTFVRCLNRMHEVVPGARMEGRVLLDGQNIYAPQVNPVRVRRHVGMVFQKPNPFPTMTIRENVLLPQPDGPIRAVICRAEMSSERPSTATTPE